MKVKTENCVGHKIEITTDNKGRIVRIESSMGIIVKCEPDKPLATYYGGKGMDMGGWSKGKGYMDSNFGPYEQSDEKKQSYDSWVEEQLDFVRSQVVWCQPKSAKEFQSILDYLTKHKVNPKVIPQEPLEKLHEKFDKK